MVKKDDMQRDVDELRKELTGTAKVDPGTDTAAAPPNPQAAPDDAKPDSLDDTEINLKDFERVLGEHGLAVDDLKGFWDQISAELKDLPAKKPLVTALGAFLIGFMAGRMSRK